MPRKGGSSNVVNVSASDTNSTAIVASMAGNDCGGGSVLEHRSIGTDRRRRPQDAGGNVVRSDQIQVANSEWRRLSQSEVNCVDRWYRTQGSNLWSQIQRGIGPSSSTAARVRAECRGQARAPGYPVIANAGSQSLAAASDAADRAAAERAAADKAAADKAAANNAADRAAADRAAADRAAADRAAADRAAADWAAANKAAAEKAAADKAIAQRAAADKAAAERAEPDIAKAEADRMKVGITKAQANPERPQKSADNKTVDAMFAFSATEFEDQLHLWSDQRSDYLQPGRCYVPAAAAPQDRAVRRGCSRLTCP